MVPAEGRRRQPRVLAARSGDRADCEAILALADIKTTHSAFKDGYDDYRYRRRWDDHYDEDEYDDDGGSGNNTRYEVQELVDSEVALTHWTGPDGTRLEETSLRVDGTEVCASTPAGDLEPYSSEYEGYMGNWGNTLDRWYHRAAVAVWPREQAFANRAETSPAWALDELAAMVSAGGASGAQATAAMLLRPFRIENLTGAHVNSFGKIADGYGQGWTAQLLRTWFGGDQPTWAYGGGQERPQWLADRPVRGAAGHGQRRRVGRAADP